MNTHTLITALALTLLLCALIIHDDLNKINDSLNQFQDGTFCFFQDDGSISTF
jgi:hypothetical protein